MIEEPKQASVWWSSSCADEIKEDTTMKIFGFLFVLIVFRNEGVVAPRFSSSSRPKRITGGRTLVLCAQHLPRRRLGRKPHPHIKLTQLGKHQRIEMSQLVSLRHLCLPSHPTPRCCSSSRLEEAIHRTALVGQQRQ